ncbi:MAG: hypothetical protein BGO78_03005 [Chloroflexi bacterium 44-23]|nr:MAG: hypothetical protein BGO78_03005 [Chloroflexi bacterium 44-23]
MSLSREISRKGETSALGILFLDGMVSWMLRPSAGWFDSYHRYLLIWRDTNTPYDWLALNNAISSSNTGFRLPPFSGTAESRHGIYPFVTIGFK